MPTSTVRIVAALISLVAWTGLAVQFGAVFGRTGSVAQTVWGMAAYFTVLTNLLVGITFAGIAAGASAFMAPALSAGTALAIASVGVIYVTLLRGLLALSGGDAFADLILHWVTPVLVPLFWWAFVPKGALRLQDPLIWALYPFSYLAYALIRGTMGGRYAYPFIDVTQVGWGQTGINVAMIGSAFLIAGYALVGLDHRVGRSARA